MSYRKMGNDDLGKCICGKTRCSILFLVQYSSIFPSAEKYIILRFFSCAESNIARDSAVFPEMLVIITKVLESTIFGRMCPYITLTWLFLFDSMDDSISPQYLQNRPFEQTLCYLCSENQ